MVSNFDSAGLIVDNSSLRLLDSIGQGKQTWLLSYFGIYAYVGEFGLVYKAHLFDDEGTPIVVAVKTLKGLYNFIML